MQIDRLITRIGKDIGKTELAVASSFRRVPQPRSKASYLGWLPKRTSRRDKKISLICSAIRSRRVIEFRFQGSSRTVEPFCLGTLLSRTDTVSLLAYLLDGPGESPETAGWQLYRLADIEKIRILDDMFSGVRDGYDSRKAGIVTVYCSVLPLPVDSAGPDRAPLSHDESMKHFRDGHTFTGPG